MDYRLGDKLASTQKLSAALVDAFNTIDRKDFVSSRYYENAYDDVPLPIGYGQTISQPSTVAFMLEQLSPRKGEKILDLGSGSGWTTALLAHLVGPHGFVVGVEIISELVEFGRRNLDKYPDLSADIIHASTDLGNVQNAPFDRILVSAAAEEIKKELIAQLKVGGRLVMPVQNSIFVIDKENDKKNKIREFPGFLFVPLINLPPGQNKDRYPQ